MGARTAIADNAGVLVCREWPDMTTELSPVNNETVLRSLVAEDLSFVVYTYLSDTPLQLRTMKEALEHGDVRMIGRAARTLRSSSERVGAGGIAQLARKLHTVVGYRGSMNDVQPLLVRLEEAFSTVGPRLLALVQERGSEPSFEPANASG